MKTSACLPVLHLVLTAVLLWLVLDQRAEIKALKKEIGPTTVFLKSAIEAASQAYNPKLTLPLQPDKLEELEITITVIDKERAQIGSEVVPLNQIGARLPPESPNKRMRGKIISPSGMPVEPISAVVDALGKHGIADITFATEE